MNGQTNGWKVLSSSLAPPLKMVQQHTLLDQSAHLVPHLPDRDQEDLVAGVILLVGLVQPEDTNQQCTGLTGQNQEHPSFSWVGGDQPSGCLPCMEMLTLSKSWLLGSFQVSKFHWETASRPYLSKRMGGAASDLQSTWWKHHLKKNHKETHQ